MGALPKRKISKRRRDIRRGADKLMAPVLSTCQKCGARKLPHFKCPNCGHYGKLEKQESSQKAVETKKPTVKKASVKTKKVAKK